MGCGMRGEKVDVDVGCGENRGSWWFIGISSLFAVEDSLVIGSGGTHLQLERALIVFDELLQFFISIQWAL